jgi:hypothetical protein
MKLKNLDNVCQRKKNFSILNLPFVTYLVEPSINNQFSKRITYIATFKGAIVIHEPINGIFYSINEAEKGCEIHLAILLDDIFQKLENVIET